MFYHIPTLYLSHVHSQQYKYNESTHRNQSLITVSGSRLQIKHYRFPIKRKLAITDLNFSSIDFISIYSIRDTSSAHFNSTWHIY